MTDNHLTLDRAVIVVCLMFRYELHFTHILITETHKRVFQKTTTFPFSCFIFSIFREAIVPMLNKIDPLIRCPTPWISVDSI